MRATENLLLYSLLNASIFIHLMEKENFYYIWRECHKLLIERSFAVVALTTV